MAGMALIDATARFAARRGAAQKNPADVVAAREEARAATGEFGTQVRSAPELTLEDAFDAIETLDPELAEAQEILDAPTKDTYTGTPEERASQARRARINKLIADAGLTRDGIPQKTFEEIESGLIRRDAEQESSRLYRDRQADERAALPSWQREAEDAYDEIAALRGGKANLSYVEGREIRAFVEQAQAAGTLRAQVDEATARWNEYRSARDVEEHQDQIDRLGELTDEQWDDAVAEDRLRAQQRIRSLRPTTYHSLKDTNRYLRGALKEGFPGVKFSVRGDSYAGGASTNVAWDDGPSEEQVRDALFPFVGKQSDYSGDYWDPVSHSGFDSDGVPVTHHYATDHIFGRRSYSDATEAAAMEAISAGMKADGDEGDFHVNRHYDEPPQWLYRMASDRGVLNSPSRPFLHANLDGYQIKRAVQQFVADSAYTAQRDVDFSALAARPHAI